MKRNLVDSENNLPKAKHFKGVQAPAPAQQLKRKLSSGDLPDAKSFKPAVAFVVQAAVAANHAGAKRNKPDDELNASQSAAKKRCVASDQLAHQFANFSLEG